MKRITILIVFFAACFNFRGYAQAVLSANDINPQVGDIYIVRSTSAGPFFPGDTGSNVTWNISAANFPGKDTVIFADCAGTPACGYFSGANIVQLRKLNSSDTTYNYFNASSTGLQALGTISLNVQLDTEVLSGVQLLSYPFTYGANFSRSYSLEYRSAIDVSHYSGTQTVTCDAYGALITPAATFSQALRVHTVSDEIDSDMFVADTFSLVYHRQIDNYSWYAADYHIALATMQTIRDSSYQDHSISFIYSANYAAKQSVGVNTLASSPANFELYPNPATDHLNIKFTTTTKQNISITLQDLLGRQVAIIGNDTYNAGEHKQSYNTSQLPKGVYIVRMQGEGVNATKKIEVL